jgi:rare lipoprotein A
MARVALLAVLALTAGCASRPPARDGVGPRPPPGLDRLPDAQPRIEPLRSGGPNKPYEVFGQRYVPLTADLPLAESGGASWYGAKFHGLPTANGETYDMYAMTAAHKTMPIPSYARVRNPANGREIVVRINDRGPFASGRVIDLSYAAAVRLGVQGGVAPVEVRRITHAEIRAGLGSAGAATAAAAPAAAASAAAADAARAARILEGIDP